MTNYALRAALTEEIVFRLLAFSAIYELVSRISKSTTIRFVSSTLISSIVFGLIHNGFYLAFVFGIGLCHIYRNNGLIFAMVIYFLADFIPFGKAMILRYGWQGEEPVAALDWIYLLRRSD